MRFTEGLGDFFLLWRKVVFDVVELLVHIDKFQSGSDSEEENAIVVFLQYLADGLQFFLR